MKDKNEMQKKRRANNGIAIEPESATDDSDRTFRLCAPFCRGDGEDV